MDQIRCLGRRANDIISMANGNYGPHANPVWSTFIFVICMVLFLFYLESMINPIDLFSSQSFVVHEYRKYQHRNHLPLLNQSRFVTYDDVTNGSFDLNITGNTLVTLHIQKTASKSFSVHVALDLDPNTGPVCNCSSPVPHGNREDLKPEACMCEVGERDKSIWFFNKLTVGWPCGTHAGWTDLTVHCLDKEINHREQHSVGRRYAMITMLRDPLVRYLNEWHHVTNNGQWPIENIHCHPLHNTNYFEDNWRGVILDEFLHCPDNPANNRQVHMLANLNNTKCSEVTDSITRHHQHETTHSQNDKDILLESAKDNLRKMAFFGLVEYLPETERLFQYTFGVRFQGGFGDVETSLSIKLTAEQREMIMKRNKLDKQLYLFAKELFFERLDTMSLLYSKLPYIPPKVSQKPMYHQ